MQPFDPDSFPPFTTPEDTRFFQHLRFLRELFPVPERALTDLAIRILGWKPPQFVQAFGGLTLKQIEKQFERDLIADYRLSRALVSYVFQPLRHALNAVLPRDLKCDGKPRPQGDHLLSEFFTTDALTDIRAWLVANETPIKLASDRALEGDLKFAEFWENNQEKLVAVLHRYVSPQGPTPKEIAHTTWLAIHLRHDTGADWNFHTLLRIALDISRRHPRSNGLEVAFFDEIGLEDTLDHDPVSHWFTPAYLQAALLETIFDGKCLPHEVIVFFRCWFLRVPPADLVDLHSTRTLYELNCLNFAEFLPVAVVPEKTVRDLFDHFDVRLARTFRRLTRNRRLLKTHRHQLHRVVGWTTLEDYFKRADPKARAIAIGRWWGSVFKHLQKQANTPGTPLSRAWLCWLEERRRAGRE